MSVDLTLAWFEAFEAALCGVMRNLEARRLARPDTHGSRRSAAEGWGDHIEGAGAERAFAKHLGVYWEGVWKEVDRSRRDVGGYEVRSTPRENGSLILHPSDPDARFVLLVGKIPTFRLAGWIDSREGKQERWWRTDTGRPAFFIPQAALTAWPDGIARAA